MGGTPPRVPPCQTWPGGVPQWGVPPVGPGQGGTPPQVPPPPIGPGWGGGGTPTVEGTLPAGST